MATSSNNSELYFLIAKFLADGPCSRAASALVEEIEENSILPKSINWLGEALPQDYKTFSAKLGHIGPGYLENLIEKLILTSPALNESRGGIGLGISRSLLSSQTSSIVLKNGVSSVGRGHSRFFGNAFRSVENISAPRCFMSQELFGTSRITRNLIEPSFYSRLKLGARSLGHLSAAYCVLFDHTGNYIFTGSDDHLVKIWSVNDGRLLATLRGNSAEITDLAINRENTLLASSSCDRYIRIWCLATGAPVAILTGHTSNVTSIFFCPMPRSRSKIRYLASTSTDGSCAFWAYLEEPGKVAEFQPKPTLYLERMRPGHAQMICSSFSSGGIFMAAGSADNNVRVYHMLDPEGPKRVLEVECHSERVDSISWAHRGVRFISGSKDGTALVWRFEYNQWKYTRISCARPTPGDPPDVSLDPKLRPRVTMVGWNADDSLVITAISNHLVKVWNPETGSLVRVLRDHTGETFVIESHPTIPRVICTAGHDGKIIVWDIGLLSDPDIESGKNVFEYNNVLEENQGTGAVFDTKWAPDGLSLAATDSHGHILILTATDNQKFAKLPKELFFHTDYRPLVNDVITNSVLDEQTQVLPHLMPPPFLVNMDGNPYPPEKQRLVPGRENCKDDQQLIPNVAIAPGGQAEVIEGLPSINARSNIDQMIAQLAAAQRGADPAEPNEDEDNRPNDLRGVAFRRSGDVEGVRRSRGNWQTAGTHGDGKRVIVPPLPRYVLRRSEEIRYEHGTEEENHFKEQKLKHPPYSQTGQISQVSPTDSLTNRQIRSRRLRRLAAQAAERRRAEEEQRISHEEGVPIPNPPQQEISAPQRAPPRASQRTPQRGPQRRARLVQAGGAGNRRIGRVQAGRDSEPEGEAENGHSSAASESSFSSSDVSGPSSSESEFSDSDWGDGTALGTGSPRKTNGATATASARKRSTRKQSDARNGAQARAESDNNSDEDYEDPRPGPSSQITRPVKQEQPKTRPRRVQRKVLNEEILDGVPIQYRPSEWLSSHIPRRFPYFPQLGDDLVFFRQGHQRYIQQVTSNKIYETNKKFLKSLPWNVNPDLEAEVPVRVVGIKFEMRPPVLVILKLLVTDWETGEPTSQVINNVVYHDVPAVVDFLILRQLYDKSKRHNWNVNDRFRCLIDDYWWLGSIQTVEPFSAAYPDSKFLCYRINWDNDHLETLSPWDIEIIPDAFEVPEGAKDEGIPASEADQRSGLYEVNCRDWPPHGFQEAECDRISNLLSEVMSLSIAEPFLTPVDLNTYPDYAYSIEYHIDLSTIKARLDNRFYRRLEALKFDIKYITLNAENFNRPKTDIVKKARIIRDLCIRISTDPTVTDVTAEYHILSKNFQWSSGDVARVRGGGNRALQRGSQTPVKQEPEPGPSSAMGRCSSRLRQKENERPRRRGNNKTIDDSKKPWQERCRDLLTKMWNCRDAQPFKEPVDIVEVPDYYQQIDTPMDLQSIKEDLLGGNYQTPSEFSKDVQLIFSNSKQYNTSKHSPIFQMTLRLKALFDCQIRPILEDWKHQKRCSTKRPQNKRNYVPSTPTKSKRNTTSRKQNTPNPRRYDSPRKNPLRNAASRNPYIQHEDTPNESSDEDEEPEADEDEYHDRRRRRRRTSGQVSSPSKRPSRKRAAVPTNGHRSSSSPIGLRNNQAGPSRAVKRLRILSGDSVDESIVVSTHLPSEPGPSCSPRKTSPRLKAGKIKYTTRSTVQPIKEVRSEGEEEDEFEESEIEMPKLRKGVSDEETSSEAAGPSVPRKRVATLPGKRVSKRRRLDDSDGSESQEEGRKTRNRGLRQTNYEEMNEEDIEYDDIEDEEVEQPEEAENYEEQTETEVDDEEIRPPTPALTTLADRVKRRRNVVTTNGHGYSVSPTKRGKVESDVEEEEEEAEAASDIEENEEEEDAEPASDNVEEEDGEEASESDDNQPGPSSRLMAQQRSSTRASLRVHPKPAVSDNEDQDEEYEHEEEQEEDEEDYDEDVGEEEDEVDEYKPTSSRNSIGRRRPISRRKSRRGDSSDEDTGRPTRHSDRVAFIRLSKPRGNGRSVYAENSDEDEGGSPTTVSVSSRGRVRRIKSYLGE